jgi:hypothetical protein
MNAGYRILIVAPNSLTDQILTDNNHCTHCTLIPKI